MATREVVPVPSYNEKLVLSESYNERLSFQYCPPRPGAYVGIPRVGQTYVGKPTTDVDTRCYRPRLSFQSCEIEAGGSFVSGPYVDEEYVGEELEILVDAKCYRLRFDFSTPS